MAWLEDVHTAIERGDRVTLRAVAKKKIATSEASSTRVDKRLV